MTDTIQYTPPPTIKEFIKDYRPGELFYDWIVGPVGCLPADAEFLTPTGWRRMDSWRPGDDVLVYDAESRAVAYEAAEYVKLPMTGRFHLFDSGSLCMALSSEHTVLYDDYRGVRKTTTAAKMAQKPSRHTIPTTWTASTPDAPLSDDAIRLRVAIAADGHLPPAGNQIIFCLRKERKKLRLRNLLSSLGISFRERVAEKRPTETVFVFSRDGWEKSLDFVWALSARQLRIVLDECTRWDGLNQHAERRFYTTRKEWADAIQYAAHATGFRATINTYNDKHNEHWSTKYTVCIRAGDNAKNRAMVRDTTRISDIASDDGFKYCFTTSTGFFVARYRNTVFITGNSGKTTGLFFKLIYLAQMQAPWRDGIRRSRAVVVRNTAQQLRDTTLASWGMWFKDGQAGTWRATDMKFTLRFGNVECEVLFRPLDTPDDVARVLSLEVTFALIDEFVNVPLAIIDGLSSRCGRYPANKDGGATNWGVFGSSNPSTEDNEWFDYLHHRLPDNARYFKQPSGFSKDAENLDNLPGGADYYQNQAKGKTPAWIKQFIEAEWGFSVSGKPVIATFNPDIHIAKNGLNYDRNHPIVVGFDPGLGGSALIFGQEDIHGRLKVYGELVQSGVGASRLVTDFLKPYIRQRFPGCEVVIAPDPAAALRSQRDEKTVVDELKRHFRVWHETNNRLTQRVTSIEHYTTRLTDAGPALLIDAEHCPVLVRALKGGWRFKLDKKENITNPEPEKNQYSHPGDAFGYLARYFVASGEKAERRARMPLPIAAQSQNTYHFR